MVTFKPNEAGERRVRFSEVRRIYLGNYPVPPTAAAATPLPEEAVPAEAIRVAANAGWVDTGVNVRRTDRVAFTTTGQVQTSGDAEDRAISAGSLKGTKAPRRRPGARRCWPARSSRGSVTALPSRSAIRPSRCRCPAMAGCS